MIERSKTQHTRDMRFIYNLAPQEDAVKYLLVGIN